MKEVLSIKQALEKNDFVIHKIKGESMLPLLDPKTDLVRLEAVACKDKLNKYDVPLFVRESDGALILHRIIEKKKDCYITYGDNCKHYEIVPFDTILAVAVGFYIKGKYVTCDDPAYLEYVEKRCDSIKKRKIYTLKKRDAAVVERTIANRIKKQGKFKFWLTKIFPPKKYMTTIYPLITKVPVLLPFYWIARLVKAPFKKSSRQAFTQELNISKKINNNKDD